MQDRNWIIIILESYSNIRSETEEREKLGMKIDEYELWKKFKEGTSDDWLIIA